MAEPTNPKKRLELTGTHKPSDFLRARRPERFSDTPKTGRPILGRDLLSYKLETLTSTKQEIEFENFVWRLAEREICPNLIPQTGPTGGGDSKTDASTYPVAPILAERWYRGQPNPPSTEYWVFAFSAKREWKPKLQVDIGKIARLDVRPKVAYFITSQFVRDRKRGELENELSTAHGFRVKILDRSWIITKTIDNGHEQLAIDHLHIDAPCTGPPPVGPRDASRKADLDKLLEDLRNPDPNWPHFALIEKYLDAGRLARELERPRSETEGLFLRARELATQGGARGRHFHALYEHAWTLFWWFDDARGMNKLYTEAAQLVADSDDAADVDLLLNLFTLIVAGIRAGTLSSEEAKLDERYTSINNLISRIAANADRPNNALHARAMGHILQLLINPSNKRKIANSFAGLKSCLAGADKCGAYPARQYIRIVSEIGQLFGDHPGYEDLFNEARRVAAKREGELREGEMLYTRGFQLLQRGCNNKALRTLSQARSLLTKRESITAAAQAQLGCELAYERLGLVWAARMDVISAFRQIMQGLREGHVPRVAARAALRMVWLELQLGRIPHVLAWHEMGVRLLGVLKAQGDEIESLIEEQETADGVLGILFLRASLDELNRLTKLPDCLEGIGLVKASLALLHALGHADVVEEELHEVFQSETDREQFFQNWATQPASDDLPAQLSLQSSRREQYKTILFGAEIRVDVDNEPSCLILAENMLGGLEAFFATATFGDILFHTSRIDIDIRASFMAEFPPKRSHSHVPGAHRWEVVIPDDFLSRSSQESIETFRRWLLETIVEVVASAGVMRDSKKLISKLGSDLAFSRTLDSAPLGIATMDVMNAADMSLGTWERGREFSLLRSNPLIRAPRSSPPIMPQQDTGQKPHALSHHIRHRDMRVISIINVPLWNKAGWSGIGVMTGLQDDFIPILVLNFKDSVAGKDIFAEWRVLIGNRDEHERIRVSIIEGLKNGTAYVVHIVADVDEAMAHVGTQSAGRDPIITTVSRINVMYPEPGSENIPRFRRSYERHREYILAPATMGASGLEPDFSVAIMKRKITFRTVDEIGKHDIDIIALRRGRKSSGVPHKPSAKTEKGKARRSGRGKRK